MSEYDDPTDINKQLVESQKWLNSVASVRNRLRTTDMQSVSDITRMYPNLSPEVASSIAYTPMFGYSPELSKTIRADYYGQSIVSRVFTNTLGVATRPLTAFFQDAYDVSISKPLRMATDIVQREQNRQPQSMMDTYNRAGTSMTARSIRGVVEGDVSPGQFLKSEQLGGGYIFGRPENQLQTPGAGRHFENLMAEGATLEEAATETDKWIQERLGIDVVNIARDSQEAVRLNVTVDGVRYNVGVSPGRLLGGMPLWELGVMTPGTVPSNLITGGLDIASNIGLDPLNPIFAEATRAFAASRRLRPDQIATPEEVIIAHGGVKITTPEMRGPHHTPGKTTMMGRTHAASAEGVVFHGGGRIPEDELFTQGGLSLSLDRSLGYARTEQARKIAAGADPEDAVIYIFDKDELGGSVKQHIDEVGEVEQFYGDTPILNADEIADVEDWVNVLSDIEKEIGTAEGVLRQYDEALQAGNPEYAEAVDVYNAHKAANEPWLPGGPRRQRQPFEPASPLEAQMIYLTPEEVTEHMRLLEQVDDLTANGFEAYSAMSGELTASQKFYGQRTYGQGFTGRDTKLITAGDFGLTPKSVVSIEDAQRMLDEGYIFPDGGGAMNDAYRFIDQELDVSRVSGSWHVKNAQEWISTPRGTAFVDWLQDTNVPRYVKRQKLRDAGVPNVDIKRMLDDLEEFPESAAKHLEAWVNNRTLTKQPTRPTTYRSPKEVPLSPTELGASSRMLEPRGAWYTWRKRWGAQSSTSKIDMWDFDATADTIISGLETAGVQPRRIDELLDKAWDLRGDFNGASTIFNLYLQEIQLAMRFKSGKVRKLSYNEDQIIRIMGDYLTEQHKASMYNINLAANPIAEGDSIWRMQRTPGGLTFETLMDQPLLDSEISMSSIHVPSARETRRLTSARRTFIDRWRDHPLGLKTTKPEVVSDAVLASWRNMQLLRPGWMMSVVPDEIGRLIAEGHGDVMTNPMFAWSIVMTRAGNELPSGRLLDELAHLEGGLGAGKFGRSLKDEPLQDLGVNGGSWQAIEVLDDLGNITEEGAKQLARNMVIVNRSRLNQVLFEFEGDIERALENLMSNPEYSDVVADIVAGRNSGAIPDPDIRLSKIGDQDPKVAREALKTLLEAADARAHLLAGGDYFKRNFIPDAQGKAVADGWLNSGGSRIEDYNSINMTTGNKWTAGEMRDEILRRDPEAANLYGVNGTHVRRNDLRVRLMEMDGVSVNLDDIPTGQTYVKFKAADQEILNVINGGATRKTPLDAQTAGKYAIDEFFSAANGNYSYIVIRKGLGSPDGSFIPAGSYNIRKQTLRAAGDDADTIIRVDMDKLEVSDPVLYRELVDEYSSINEPFAHYPEGIPFDPDTMKSMSRAQLTAARDEIVQRGETKRIFDEMDHDDIEGLVDFVRDELYSDEFPAPPRVKGPSSVAGERLSAFDEGIDGTRLINAWFDTLGRKPSEAAARGPYSRIRTWQVFADYYLYATPTIRKEIIAAAKKAGIPEAEFAKFITRSKRLNGLGDNLPLPAKSQLTLLEIEDIAARTAIEDTRQLFFDLSKRGNWADAMKIIAPFADAWWEVLTRWGKLFNPAKAQDFSRPFKNLDRITRGIEGAERSGYFDTNERGEKVFMANLRGPLGALLGAGEGLGLGMQGGFGQIGFVDLDDTRGLLAPGGGFTLQLGAAAVRAKLPSTLRDVADWVAYGQYDPTVGNFEGVIGTVLPSYMMKLLYGVMAGEYDERFASRQIDIMNTVYAADPGEYGDVSTNPATLARLTNEAQKISGRYTPLEILASWISPIQPRLVIELESADGLGRDQAFNMVSVIDDYAFLSQWMESTEALDTVIRWYGQDPLAVARKSYSVLQRPISKTSFDFIGNNTEAYDLMPYTISAYMPQEEGETLYGPEYRRQIEEGERHKLSPTEAFVVLSYNQGRQRLAVLQEQRQQYLAEAETRFGKDSQNYRDYRDDSINAWYAQAKRGIETMYFGYAGSTGGPPGLPKRVSYQHIRDEMLRTGTPGSAENDMGHSMNTRLTAGLEEITALWNMNEQIAIQEGRDASWWYSGSSTTDQSASLMRNSFSRSLRSLVGSMDDDHELQLQLKWYIDYVVTPLMQGVSPDQPFIVDIDPLLIPEL